MASVILAFMYIICLSSTFYYWPCLANGNPLLIGSKERWPGNIYAYENEEVRRLLDVGACLYSTSTNDDSISYVPPLDGTSPGQESTRCQDWYAMKIVLFDLQLVQLKAVEPVDGIFTVQLVVIFHWIDSIIEGSDGIQDNCSFLCDSMSPTSPCCDKVWVPPFQLHPRCKINEIQHSLPKPPIYYGDIPFGDCFLTTKHRSCNWRRIWYINIDATCSASNMNFHDFPFDVQELPIDFLNPYASRTWFQLTKGFLKQNIGENINGINLNPDKKIPGWFVKDLRVSSTCDTSQAWKQTFLAQDDLLARLGDQDNASRAYSTQQNYIAEALTLKKLRCDNNMQNINISQDDGNLFSSTSKKLYEIALTSYEERVNSTLNYYRQCMTKFGKDFHWSKVIDGKQQYEIPGVGLFDTTPSNINRSFNVLDLKLDQQNSKVWFPCVIAAVANLTTPGIRVNIIIKRYRMFYVVKLILPILACVAFTFSAFGLQPDELIGRLTVVVPSAIALAALQGLVVSSDVSPVAYITPTTYIILFSYLAQLLIAFESILVYRLCKRTRGKKRNFRRRSLSKSKASLGKRGAHTMYGISNEPYEEKGGDTSADEDGRIQLSSQAPFSRSISHDMEEAGATSTKSLTTQTQSTSANNEVGDSSNNSRNPHASKKRRTRVFDLRLMGALILLYIASILVCVLLPWHNSFQRLKNNDPSVISIWN